MDLIGPEDFYPWVTFGAIDWLKSYLRSDMSVFEWGSGGSTLYFSKQVKRVVSVEHDQAWHAKVLATLQRENAVNCEYSLILPRTSRLAHLLPYRPYTYVSRTFEAHKDMFFRKYVREIDGYADRSFDLVMVDGRSRGACLVRAVKKVKQGGYLLLDNSERPLYQPAMQLLSGLVRTDFFGNGPRLQEQWQTTVWQVW